MLSPRLYPVSLFIYRSRFYTPKSHRQPFHTHTDSCTHDSRKKKKKDPTTLHWYMSPFQTKHMRAHTHTPPHTPPPPVLFITHSNLELPVYPAVFSTLWEKPIAPIYNPEVHRSVRKPPAISPNSSSFLLVLFLTCLTTEKVMMQLR